MSVATGAGETDEFATLLRQFKDRSGLSYGALAKRLHMSTSTLHRYCNGTAVPNEYAPVERLARLCRATPGELVELHRRWILADAARERRAEEAAAARGRRTDGTDAHPAAAADLDMAGDAGAGADADAAVDTAPIPDAGATPTPTPDTAAASYGRSDDGELVVTDLPRSPAPPRRRRTALIAAAVVAAVLGAVVLAVNSSLVGGNSGDNAGGNQQAAGATVTTTGPADAAKPSVTPSSTAPSTPSSTPASATTTPGRAAPGATNTGGSNNDSVTNTVPLTVGVHPYVYEDQCSQHFLVDSEPAHMGPPPSEQDAPRWAASYGAVSSDNQRLSLTVQGTGAETVVLEALHVRVVAKDVPLAWNDYSMGAGCGGGVDSKSFDVDLDNGSPGVTVKNGQRDFPYSVSESDPEVFYVTAHTKAHDVRWDLLLDWSSGSRHGTVHIDNKGASFRTSADVGRPGYDYPPGYNEWIKREGG